MTDQTDPTPTPAPTADERPAWLPDKFKDAEQMAQAYTALEQHMGSGTAPAPAAQVGGPAPEVPVHTDGPPHQAGIPQIPQAPEPGTQESTDALWGTDALASYSESIQTSGDLSAEQRTALKDAGIPDAMVNSHVEGWKAQAQLATQAVYGITGGQDNFQSMVNWAQGNLPAGEQTAFNDAINSGDVNTASAAVRGLYSQFSSGNGSPMATRGTEATLAAYADMGQLQADQRNPLYKTDATFRKQVQARLSNSRF